MLLQKLDERVEREVTAHDTRLSDAGNGVVKTVRNGVVVFEGWYRDFKPHGEHGPALIHRDATTGEVTSEIWMRQGKLHRERGPAILRRNPKTRIVEKEAWYRDGKPNRYDDKPAVTRRDGITGQIVAEAWFIEGTEISRTTRALVGRVERLAKRLGLS